MAFKVSIHGLLRALTSRPLVIGQECEVSIHGLLRALTVPHGSVVDIR